MKRSSFWLLTALTTSASPFSWACSYDGQFSNPFTESYPGSLDIAIATQEAIKQQQVQRPDSLTGTPGLQRASWWLNLMVKQYPNLSPNSYIYLVDSQLWSKYEASGKLSIHVNPPDDGAHVLLVSEAALYNLVNHKLPLETAIELGVVKHNSQTADTLLSKN